MTKLVVQQCTCIPPNKLLFYTILHFIALHIQVKDAAEEHRKGLNDLDDLLEKIGNDPEPLDNRFEMRLRQLQQTVTATLAEAQITAKPSGDKGTLRDRLSDLDEKLEEVTKLVSSSNEQIQKAKMEGREADNKATNAKQMIFDARTALKVC